ncbi:MAG: hypothetical protein Q9212_006042 [Teloschistes hypoglaucus]
MDHVPYPSSSQVPPIEVPFLYKTGRDWSNQKTDRSCNQGAGDGASAIDRIWTEVKSGTTTSAVAPYRITDASAPPPFGSKPPDHSSCTTTSDWTIDFWKYPEQQGWCASSGGSWLTPSPEQSAGRAQEWLYVELLRRFIGQQIEISSLARQSRRGEPKVLDSCHLPDLLAQWATRQSLSEVGRYLYIGATDEKAGKQSPVLSLLARVAAECGRLDDIPEPCQSTSLAIRLLVDTLANTIYKLANVSAINIPLTLKLQFNPLLKHRFHVNGWCPRQIALLWGRYSPTTAYYLSSLPHRTTFGGVKHHHCNENRCATASVDPATYEHQHADGCSTASDHCRMVGVPSARVAECIKGGHIPLIKFQELSDGMLQPEVVEFRSDLRYVALSHVWSGGLGNVEANSMFSCQVRKIYDLLRTIQENGDDDLDRDRGPRKLQGSKRDVKEVLGIPIRRPPVLLWIDTLCVPVGQQHVAMRQKAIAQMAQIYVQAQCVLVLDPELPNIGFEGLPREQIFASVLCSAWNSRSWTLQEACMARVFYVQFADGYYVLDQKWHDFIKGLTAAVDCGSSELSARSFGGEMRDSLMLEVSDWFRQMPLMTKIRSYDSRTLMTKSEDWQNFSRVWNALRTRSTTKMDDLYGIIAIMVDLSAYEILKLDPQERMKAILRSQSSLPLSLLYQKCTKLVDSKGMPSWAPSELAGGHLEMNTGFMSLQDDGLLIDVDRPGAAQHEWPSAYLFSTEGPISSSLNFCTPDSETTLRLDICSSSEENDQATTGTWIMLIHDGPGHRQSLREMPGVLLSVLCNQDKQYRTAYFSPIRVIPKDIGITFEEESIGCAGLYSTRPVEAQRIPLEGHSIKIVHDITFWYKPKLRMKNQLLSRRVVIRNLSNATVFGAVVLTSVLYMAAIIGCAVHHRRPLPRKILYLAVPRYVSHFLELFWLGIEIVHFDGAQDSMEKESRLMSGISVHGWVWAKWYGIIGFAEIGVRLTFTWVVLWFLYSNLEHLGMAKEDLSDLPEDMTNYSRRWSDNNKNTWVARQKRKRKHDI